jgi:hypothetical protein
MDFAQQVRQAVLLTAQAQAAQLRELGGAGRTRRRAGSTTPYNPAARPTTQRRDPARQPSNHNPSLYALCC